MCDYCEKKRCADCIYYKRVKYCEPCVNKDAWKSRYKYCPECGRPLNALYTPEDIAEHVEAVLAGCNTYVLSSIDGEGNHVGRFKGVSVDANGSLVINADIDKVFCTGKSSTILESLEETQQVLNSTSSKFRLRVETLFGDRITTTGLEGLLHRVGAEFGVGAKERARLWAMRAEFG